MKLIPPKKRGTITRRSFGRLLGAGIVCAPAIVRAQSNIIGSGIIGDRKVTGGGGFTPGGLGANLIGWFQAAVSGSNTTAFNTGTTPATNGQTVTTWADSSPSPINVSQGTSGLRPVWNSAGFNSGPCMTFSVANTTGMNTSSSISGLTTFSVFMYGAWNNATPGGDGGRVFCTTIAGIADGASTTSYIPIIRGTTNIEGFLGGTGSVANQAFTWNGGHHVVGSVRNGTNIKTYVDGTTSGGSTVPNFTWGSIFYSIGCGLNASTVNDGNCFDGQIVEVIIANTDLSSQAAAIGTYFTGRWGV